MDNISLCFSTYYFCVVNANTPHERIDAVNILLYGKKRGKGFAGITDAMASEYVSGHLAIPIQLRKAIANEDINEVERRIRLLHLSDLQTAFIRLRNLVNFVARNDKNDKLHLHEISDTNNSDTAKIEGRYYRYLSEVFIHAISASNPYPTIVDQMTARTINVIISAANIYDEMNEYEVIAPHEKFDAKNLKEKKKKVVFISYSWDNDIHQDWVRHLSDDLEATQEISTILDVKNLVFGDLLPRFMEQSIVQSDYVLLICTPNYKSKADNYEGGVGYEGAIITGDVYIKNNHRKYIPILAQGSWGDSLPVWARGKLGADMSSPEKYSKTLLLLVQTIMRGV